MVLGSFDSMTFGVPLGFYSLVASTGHGAYSLSQGQYEQATRELAPAALLVALYAGGKGVRALSVARGVEGLRGLPPPALRLKALQETARLLEARLGVDGLRELARDIRASREAGHFVAVGGVDAALALREARGDVARAQAWLSQARPERVGRPGDAPPRRAPVPGSPPVACPRWWTSRRASPRRWWRPSWRGWSSTPRALACPGTWRVLEKQRPSLDAPPPGAQGNPRWSEYVAYYEQRLAERKAGQGSRGASAVGGL